MTGAEVYQNLSDWLIEMREQTHNLGRVNCNNPIRKNMLNVNVMLKNLKTKIYLLQPLGIDKIRPISQLNIFSK